MIADITRIKQHRTDRQARQVKTLENELNHIRERKRQSAETLNAFIQWQRDEHDRLFHKLSEAPASLLQVDSYNREVSRLAVRRNELVFEFKQIEEEEFEARKRLQDAYDQWQIAEKNQKRFESVAKEVHQKLARDLIRLEDLQAEELSAESFQNHHRHNDSPLSAIRFNTLIGEHQ
ncbi:type III secretion system stalk subunit SctO [Hahella ganghwensis]|uniref:type III secretion system stalk subunit SctO n=1 Tax=Hahella ganghwensis TaxID=286420 RepID=UPI0003671E17|nr:YscO family type III secretion system apparatus protein [Hahella ganghwensis]